MKKQLICSKIFPSEWLGPDSSVGKESACNAGDTGFVSWVGKIYWRRDRLHTPVFLGFPCGSAGKESACNVEELGSIPGFGGSLGEEIINLVLFGMKHLSFLSFLFLKNFFTLFFSPTYFKA